MTTCISGYYPDSYLKFLIYLGNTGCYLHNIECIQVVDSLWMQCQLQTQMRTVSETHFLFLHFLGVFQKLECPLGIGQAKAVMIPYFTFRGHFKNKKVPNFFFLLIFGGYIYIYIYIYEPCDWKKLWSYRMYFNS